MILRISARTIGNVLAVILFCIFEFCSPGWALAQSQLGADIDGNEAWDSSGQTIALSANGSRLAISAQVLDSSGTNPGQVRVYAWSGTFWQQIGEVIDGKIAGSEFGRSVSLSADGNRLAIGAPDDESSAPGSGYVQVFTWSGNSWLQLGEDIYGEASFDSSGYSVSLANDGNRLAIGAPGNDGNGERSGHVRVYSWSDNAWLQLGDDIDGETAGDLSGFSVSLSDEGNRLSVGAPTNDGNGPDSGHVRVFTWSGTSWVQLGEDIDGEAAGDWSGSSMAVSLSADGSRLAIGAQRNERSTGHVRVYEWSGTAWLQLGDDIDGDMPGDGFGRSVSLAAGGNLLAISAPYKDGSGSESGQVQIYTWSDTRWRQLGEDIDGEAAFDEFGASVSLSGDCERVAIGAPFNDGNENNSGHVRVYQLSMSISIEDSRSIARLYSAAFDRLPKFDGLNFWIDSFKNGNSLVDIARKFNESPEFVDKYGPLTDREYVEQLFRNVLGREGEPGGIDFWEGHLDNATPRAKILAEFSESPENELKTAPRFANMRCEGGRWIF
jgi:hypothetical protein